MENRVLSIEIGYGLTKVSELDYGGKNHKVYHCFRFETPKDMLMDGQVTSGDEFAVSLKEELKKRKIKTKKVIFTVTSTKIANREIFLPAVKNNKIKTIVMANSSDYFPIDLSQYQLAYTELERITEGEEKKIKVLVLAVPSALLDSYYTLSANCGLSMIAFDYNGNSVGQFATQNYRLGTNVVLKVDERSSVLTIVKEQKIVLQRTIGYGAEEAIEILKTSNILGKKLSYIETLDMFHQKNYIHKRFAEIDGYSSTEDDSPEIVSIKNEITDALHYLNDNVSRIMDYYNSKNQDKIEHFYLIGLGAYLNGLNELLTNETGYNVEIKNEVLSHRTEKTKKEDYVEFSEYYSCFGASLKPIEFVAEKIDKGKIGKRKEGKAVSFRGTITIFVLLLFVAAALAVYPLWNYGKIRNENKTIQAQLDSLAEVKNTVKTYQETNSLYLEYKSKFRMTDMPIDYIDLFIGELEEKLPTDCIVTSFNATPYGVTLNIKAGTKDVAATAIMQLRKFESLSDIIIAGTSEQAEENGGKAITIVIDCIFSNINDNTMDNEGLE